MQPDPSRTVDVLSTGEFLSQIQTLLDQQRYDEARARASQRLGRKPGDRTARLSLLLVNVTAFGVEGYGPEINELRTVSAVDEQEREVVRRLFLMAFNSAEKHGDEKQALVYQRWLRKLLLRQPLDDPDSNLIALPLPSDRPARAERQREPVVIPPSRVGGSSVSPSLPAVVAKVRLTKANAILLIGAAVLGLALAILVRAGKEDGLENPNRTMRAAAEPRGEAHPPVKKDTVRNSSPEARDTLDQMVGGYVPGLEQIYRKWSKTQPNLSERITFRVTLDRSGNVMSVEDLDTNSPQTGFRSAIRDQVRQWKFSNKDGVPEEFILPLVFGNVNDSIAGEPADIKISGVAQANRNAPAAGRNISGRRQNKSLPANSGAFAVLLFSVLLWAASLFCLAEALKTQYSFFTESDRVAQSHAAVDIAQLLSFLFVLGWFGRNLFLSPPGESPLAHFARLLIQPEHLTPGILLAVFPPVLIGLVKLVAGIGLVQKEPGIGSARQNWFWINSTYLAVLLVLGITAALLLYFHL